MKTKLLSFIIALVFGTGIAMAAPLGRAFTYQGQLSDGAGAANGAYDLKFTLHDSVSGPTLINAPLTNTTTPISNGLFTVVLDFGPGAFGGEARWLEIAVRTNGSPADFVILTPRQSLTATPFARYAASAGNAASAGTAAYVDAANIAGTISSGQIAPGAIGPVHLGANAVTASNIAPGTITSLELAKPPRAGSIASSTLLIDLNHASFNVAFNPPFNSSPIVTLGLESDIASLGAKSTLSISSKSSSGFAGHWNVPAPTAVTIDTAGGSSSMILVNGKPAIAYTIPTNGTLVFVLATDTNGTAWTTPVTVDSGLGPYWGYVSLASVNGNPAVAYDDPVNGDLKYARATDDNGTAWGTPITLDTAGNTGDDPDLVMVNGNPAISYYDASNGNLKYVRATDANGTVWATPLTLASATLPTGSDFALAVVNGNPAISYTDTSYKLKYMRSTDANGAVWGIPVTVFNDEGWSTSLVVVNGNPAISFIGSQGALCYARATDANGTAWNLPGGNPVRPIGVGLPA